MREWYEIYRDRMNEHYRNHVARKYAPFLEQLHHYQGDVTTEIGCGAGNITRILREMETRPKWHFLTDSCPKMLGLAVENNPVPKCNFSISDIREMVPANCDLIHSHGLLEHFDDATIRQVVRNMFYAAPIQIHYVPGARYEKPSRGDERLLSVDEWKEILSPYRKARVEPFNNEFDLLLRIER